MVLFPISRVVDVCQIAVALYFPGVDPGGPVLFYGAPQDLLFYFIFVLPDRTNGECNKWRIRRVQLGSRRY